VVLRLIKYKATYLTITQLSYSPLIAILRPILRSGILLYIGGEMGRKTLRFFGYFHSQVDQRIASNNEARKDFMSYLLEAQDPETGIGFTRNELDAESGLLITAGSDTSSGALTAIMFYLLHNPQALGKATSEVRNHFSSVDDIHGLSLSTELPYLYACIDEGMRLSPPVPSHIYREVLQGGINVDDHHIPQGTIVGVSAYVIHHNPEYYPDPFAFRPERWILDEKASVDEDSLAKARAAFSPFSQGSRGCIGKKVAYAELLTALAVLLYTYDMRLPAKEKQRGGGDLGSKTWGRQRADEYQLKDMFLGDGEGPMVEFRARSQIQ
jgi:cytochrome P450